MTLAAALVALVVAYALAVVVLLVALVLLEERLRRCGDRPPGRPSVPPKDRGRVQGRGARVETVEGNVSRARR